MVYLSIPESGIHDSRNDCALGGGNYLQARAKKSGPSRRKGPMGGLGLCSPTLLPKKRAKGWGTGGIA
jgi:hypothetical protein